MKYRRHDLHGFLLVDKPMGCSSMDVVRVVRKAAGHVKTGHAGTLDPLATGLLICCLGKATRAVDTLMAQTKTYQTAVDLTAFTTTDDREGERTEIKCTQIPDIKDVRDACEKLTGEIDQIPPAYSAIHVNGVRAYKLVRRGEDVQMNPRKVLIENIEVERYDWPVLDLKVDCGKGVYIRSLARDLGKLLGTGGHLASLRRTRIGMFHVEHAYPLDQIREQFDDAWVFRGVEPEETV